MKKDIKTGKSLSKLFDNNQTHIFLNLLFTKKVPDNISEFFVLPGNIFRTGGDAHKPTILDIQKGCNNYLDDFYEQELSSSGDIIFRMVFKITRKKCPKLRPSDLEEISIRVSININDITKPITIDAMWPEPNEITSNNRDISISEVWPSIPPATRKFIIEVGEAAGLYILMEIIKRTAPFEWISRAYALKKMLEEKLPQVI
ncbi:MAG: hypothetical protein WC523_07985 [Patescibacteria group bacterium]